MSNQNFGSWLSKNKKTYAKQKVLWDEFVEEKKEKTYHNYGTVAKNHMPGQTMRDASGVKQIKPQKLCVVKIGRKSLMGKIMSFNAATRKVDVFLYDVEDGEHPMKTFSVDNVMVVRKQYHREYEESE